MNDEKLVSQNVQRSMHMNSYVASYTLTAQHVRNDGKPSSTKPISCTMNDTHAHRHIHIYLLLALCCDL